MKSRIRNWEFVKPSVEQLIIIFSRERNLLHIDNEIILFTFSDMIWE